jgi:hypothetical protein
MTTSAPNVQAPSRTGDSQIDRALADIRAELQRALNTIADLRRRIEALERT